MMNIFLTAAVAISAANAVPVESQEKRVTAPQGTFETAEEYKARLEFQRLQARLIPAGRPLGPSPKMAEKR